MKYIYTILLLIFYISVFSQQMGGAGHANGHYKSNCSLYLASDSSTTCTDALTWYPLKARLIDGHDVDFILDELGVVYTRSDTISFHFIGTGNGVSNKAANITLALFKNSESDPIDGAQGTIYFHNANQYEGFSNIRDLNISPMDTLKVKIRSDQANTIFTSKEINVNLIQTR